MTAAEASAAGALVAESLAAGRGLQYWQGIAHTEPGFAVVVVLAPGLEEDMPEWVQEQRGTALRGCHLHSLAELPAVGEIFVAMEAAGGDPHWRGPEWSGMKKLSRSTVLVHFYQGEILDHTAAAEDTLLGCAMA